MPEEQVISAEQLELAMILQELDHRDKFTNMDRYAEDPAGFIEVVLGDTLTPDLRAICESVVKYRVTIAISGNGTGKSWISARLAAWFYKCRVQPQVYLAAAPPETNLRNICWAELSAVVNSHKELFEDDRVKDLRVERAPLEFVTGVSIPSSGNDQTKQARFSGKHAPSLMFAIDEADAVPDPVFAGIETCLSGGFERLLCTFNPRQRLGAVYRMVQSGQANIVRLTAFNHPNVIAGEDLIPGAVDRKTTVRRIAQWTRPLADGERIDKRCFELPDFLEGCTPVDQKGKAMEPLAPGWYRIVEHQFSHVVLGEYPAQADNQLISEEWIDKARSRYDLYTAEHGERPPAHVKCIAGLDVAEHGSDASVLARRYGILLLPLSIWEGKQEVIDVGDLAAAKLADEDLSSIQCDGTGVGSGVAPYLGRKNLPAVSVKVASSPTEETELGHFGILRDQLLWSIREWLRTDLAMLPPDPELIEELTVLTYEVDKGKIKVMPTDDIKELLRRSPDRAMALAMSFHQTGKFSGVDLS